MNLPQIAVIAFLVLLILVPLVLFAVNLARSQMNPLQCVLWGFAYVLCKFLWRTRWGKWPDLPPGRGAVVVCNHRSSVDPFFVQTGTARKIQWMVAREFCEHPLFRWFLRNCEVIPVGRGGIDTAATKAAIRIVTQGGVVGMLPEGRINMTTEFMLPARPGAALVAIKANALIVPCYIHGAPFRRYPWSPFFMPARVEVRYGEPIDVSSFLNAEGEGGDAQEATLRILQALAELAGRNDYQPKLAGRNWKPTAAELEDAMSAAEQREKDI